MVENMTNYNIDEIRELTIEETRQIALETMGIKEHECIFVDFGGYFGYSVLVFKNGRHIHYADDFELHHGYIVKEKGREALKQWYIESLNRKLYTDAELLEEVTSYDEYEKKNYTIYNSVSFCYVKDKSIVDTQTKYLKHLEEAYNRLKDSPKTFREMVSHELANHEACITCGYEDALDALGLKFENLTEDKQQIVMEELRKQMTNY